MNRLMSCEGDILPALEGTLIYFASDLARTVKHSTIKFFLSAVRNVDICFGNGKWLYGVSFVSRGGVVFSASL